MSERDEIARLTASRDRLAAKVGPLATALAAAQEERDEFRASEQAAWDRIEGWNDLEQERDEYRNSRNFYAAETKRLTAELAAVKEASR